MDVKRNQLIETIVWVGIPMLFMIVDRVYKHVFNIEYFRVIYSFICSSNNL